MADEEKDRTDLVRIKSAITAKLRVIAMAHRASMGDVIEELAGKLIDEAHDAIVKAGKLATKQTARPVPPVLTPDLGGEAG